jgi:hypothetical protein
MQFQNHGRRRIGIRGAGDEVTAEVSDQKFGIFVGSAYNPGIMIRAIP